MGVSFILKKVQVKESFLTDKSLSNTLKSEGKYQCSPITIPACLPVSYTHLTLPTSDLV